MAICDDKVYDSIGEIDELQMLGVKIRKYNCSVKDKSWQKNYMEFKGFGERLLYQESVCVLDDGMNSFADFDYGFVMSDASPSTEPIFWEIPHAVVAHDYIQHYVPHLISDEAIKIKILNQRKADCVLVTSKPSEMDAYTYGGFAESKVFLTPYMLEIADIEEHGSSSEKRSYFIWSTNAAKHKNHLKALEALRMYYEKGGELECYITGTNTKYFTGKYDLESAPVNEEYVSEIIDIINSSDCLKEKLHIMGELRKHKYLNLLNEAAFLIHPGYGDNGNGSIFDAVSLGVPSLVSDYPAMRYMGNFMSTPLSFMDPFDPVDMMNALFDMEKNYCLYAMDVPSREKLVKADYRNVAMELYKVVKEVAYI